MKKSFGGIKVYWMLIVVAVALIGIVFGSIFDLQISTSFVNFNSGFGKFFEAFGEALGYAMAPIGATLFFMGLKDHKNKWMKVLAWSILVLGIAIPTYFLGHAAMSEWAFAMKAYFAYPIAFFLMALTSMLVFFLAGVEDKNLMIKAGLVIMIAMVAQVIILNVLKQINMRPRWRAQLIDGYVWEYRAWWQFSFDIHNFPCPDYLRSWPSGHTATASIAFLLPLLAKTKKKQFIKHEELVLFIIAFVYVIITAIARIRIGAHYLSDVSFGMLIGSLISFLTVYIAFPEKKKQPEAVEAKAE